MSDKESPKPRWELFIETIDRALQGITRNIRHEEISRAVPRLYRHLDNENLDHKYEQMQTYFDQHARRDLNSIFKSDKFNAEESFKLLDEVIEKGKARKARYERAVAENKTPDPADLPIDFDSLSPRQIVACTVAVQAEQRHEALYKRSDAIDAELRETEAEIKQVEEEVLAVRDEVQGISTRLERFLAT